MPFAAHEDKGSHLAHIIIDEATILNLNHIQRAGTGIEISITLGGYFRSQFIAVGVEHERGANCGEFGVAFRESKFAVSKGVDDFSSSLHNPSLSLLSLHNMNSRGVIHYCFTGLLGSGGSSASGGRLMGLDTGAFFFLKRLLKKFM